MANKKTAAIRDLNDRFRKGDTSVPGQVFLTIGVKTLLEEKNVELHELFTVVREFDEFTKDNDPWHEHDFGAFEFLKYKMFWKLEYYAPDMEHGLQDPADIYQTIRVLTIMLVEEY